MKGSNHFSVPYIGMIKTRGVKMIEAVRKLLQEKDPTELTSEEAAMVSNALLMEDWLKVRGLIEKEDYRGVLDEATKFFVGMMISQLMDPAKILLYMSEVTRAAIRENEIVNLHMLRGLSKRLKDLGYKKED